MINSIVPQGRSDAITQLVWNPAIRRVEFQGKVYYSLVDLVLCFADTSNEARVYWSQLKKRLKQDGANELYHHIIQLPLTSAKDGKHYKTDVGDIIAVKRVIMSIPSEKAEPLRMYMAGKTDALLAYRAMNVRDGLEWAADGIHEDMKRLDAPDYESPWEDLGYKKGQG